MPNEMSTASPHTATYAIARRRFHSCGPNSARATGIIHSLRQDQNATPRSRHGTSAHNIATATTPISTNDATPSGWLQACRKRGSACPLASRPISISAIAAFATGGEIITLQAATIVDQRAISIARDAGSAPSVFNENALMPLRSCRTS